MSLQEMIRRVVGRAMAAQGRPTAPGPAAPRPTGVHVEMRPGVGAARPADPAEAGRPGKAGGAWLIAAEDLAGTPDGGVFRLPRGAKITPLAREEAFRRGIHLSDGAALPEDRCPRAGEPLRVAVGADHGGFALKGDVIAWLRELGHRPVDLGTHDENPVDYPDFAAAVAQAVGEGRCDLGVLIDGAGIGSAMAANKVAGVRAANCHDPAMAKNAREHNYANVLTLGAKMIGPSKSHEVLRTFLSTPWGAERHGRRVAKITALEGPGRGASNRP